MIGLPPQQVQISIACARGLGVHLHRMQCASWDKKCPCCMIEAIIARLLVVAGNSRLSTFLTVFQLFYNLCSLTPRCMYKMQRTTAFFCCRTLILEDDSSIFSWEASCPHGTKVGLSMFILRLWYTKQTECHGIGDESRAVSHCSHQAKCVSPGC